MAFDALSLANVDTFYGDSHILHGVNFSLQPGGVLALLGRNGAGKTTCISTIFGFLRPRRGDIRLFGEQIEGLSPERISRLGIGLDQARVHRIAFASDQAGRHTSADDALEHAPKDVAITETLVTGA